MTGRLIRHPWTLSVVAVALIAAAVTIEVVDLIHLNGAMRIGAALLFVVTAAASFVGFRAAWRKKAREGTLVLDPEEQARVAQRAVWPGRLIAFAITIGLSAFDSRALESALAGVTACRPPRRRYGARRAASHCSTIASTAPCSLR
jgi:hypothetical protein